MPKSRSDPVTTKSVRPPRQAKKTRKKEKKKKREKWPKSKQTCARVCVSHSCLFYAFVFLHEHCFCVVRRYPIQCKTRLVLKNKRKTKKTKKTKRRQVKKRNKVSSSPLFASLMEEKEKEEKQAPLSLLIYELSLLCLKERKKTWNRPTILYTTQVQPPTNTAKLVSS